MRREPSSGASPTPTPTTRRIYAGAIEAFDGNLDRAKQHWDDAAELAVKLDMPYELARARAARASLATSRGCPDDALADRDAACNAFRELGAVHDLRATEEHLEQLSAQFGGLAAP